MSQGIDIRVMDPFTIKPLDVTAVQEHGAACGGRIVTVEDHYPEVGNIGVGWEELLELYYTVSNWSFIFG